MKIVKTFCGRWLDNYELVFLGIGRTKDGFHALIEGDETEWSDGPFATFDEAVARLKERAAELGMNPDLDYDVVTVLDRGSRPQPE